MKICNLGSLNLDITYRVDHIAAEGETVFSHDVETNCGGKGLNQSVSLAKAGAEVYHAGLIGEDGDILLEMLRENGVNTGLIRKRPGRSGHAVIQVNNRGQNCILLYGGANRQIDRSYAEAALEPFAAGDFLLLQNEISELPYIILKAAEKGMRIILNPSPCDEHLEACDLSKVELFLLNEVEGCQMTGEKQPERILKKMRELYPDSRTVLTLGADGALFDNGRDIFRQEIFPVQAVDTTGAGDTFTGYFTAAYMQGKEKDALEEAAAAAAIAVTRRGAARSVPTREEVIKMLAVPPGL